MAADPVGVAQPGSSATAARWPWLLLVFSSAIYFFSANEADNDLWGHVLFGRTILATHTVPSADTFSYTAFGQPWINHEWLSQVVLAAVYQLGGSAGLLLCKLAVALVTCAVLLQAIRRHTDAAWLWGGLGLLTIAVLARGFAIRPQILSYAALTLLLAVLDIPASRRKLWLIPPLFLVWANLHGGFILGLAVLGVFVVAQTVSDAASAGRVWLIAGAAGALSLLNPNGWRLYAFVWNELSRSHPITEWQPVGWLDPAQFAFVLMLALFVLSLPLRRDWRRNGWEAVVALAVAAAAIHQQRHTVVFALCAAIPLAQQLETARRRWGERIAVGLDARRAIAASVVALSGAQLALTGMRLHRDGLRITFDPADYPVAAVQALRRADIHGNVALPLEWGEYALWFLAPRMKVSLDGRFATVFPEQVVADNFAFFAGAPDWRRLLDDFPTQFAVVPTDAPCPIAGAAGWRLMFQDRTARVFARDDIAVPMLQVTAEPVGRTAAFP